MNRFNRLVGVALLAFGLSSCSSNSDDPTPATTSLPAITTTSVVTTSSSSPTSEEPTEVETPVEQVPVQSAEPETATVAQTPAGPGNGYRCLRTDGYTWDPSTCAYGAVDSAQELAEFQEKERLAQIPYADGGTCAAAVCGYGTNAQGQPNPTSGEIQTLGGCQAGYITDAELCESVSWVENHQY